MPAEPLGGTEVEVKNPHPGMQYKMRFPTVVLAEVPVRLGCVAASMSNRIPNFQSNAAATSSMVKMSMSNGQSSWTFRHL